MALVLNHVFNAKNDVMNNVNALCEKSCKEITQKFSDIVINGATHPVSGSIKLSPSPCQRGSNMLADMS